MTEDAFIVMGYKDTETNLWFLILFKKEEALIIERRGPFELDSIEYEQAGKELQQKQRFLNTTPLASLVLEIQSEKEKGNDRS